MSSAQREQKTHNSGEPIEYKGSEDVEDDVGPHDTIIPPSNNGNE